PPSRGREHEPDRQEIAGNITVMAPRVFAHGIPETLIRDAEKSPVFKVAVERISNRIYSLAAESGSTGDPPIIKKPQKSKDFSPRFAIVAAALEAASTA